MGSWAGTEQVAEARMSRSAVRNAALTVAAVFALGVLVPAIFGPAEAGRAARGRTSARVLTPQARTVQEGVQARLGAPLENLRARGAGRSVTPTT